MFDCCKWLSWLIWLWRFMAMENKPTIQQIIATWWILCMYMYIAPDMQNIRAQVKVVAPAHIPVMHRWKLWHLHTFQSCFDSIKPFNAIKGVSYRIKAWNCHKTHREAIITECLFWPIHRFFAYKTSKPLSLDQNFAAILVLNENNE